MPAAGEMRFLGVARSIDTASWDDPLLPKLWRYNQHYFDDLNAVDAPERTDWHEALIADWIRENPPGRGTGWEPYPTSLRIVNWVKWALAGHNLPAEALQSLAVQARWLTRRLERHLLGNHLFQNAKALLFAGCFFAGSEADGWCAQALRILQRELVEQVLPDGGHFELSTMYHALAFEDVLDLLNLARAYPEVWPEANARLAPIAARMERWLAIMSHPDGEIGFFNDAAIGIAPSPAELHAYARRLGLAEPASLGPIEHLDASGYVRAAMGPATLLADIARVGPDFLPGHAHADTLSFELSIGGQRFLVNGGTSLYEPGAQRLAERGTAAHNTAVVNGENSSEVWSSFRVARRARPFEVRLDAGPPVSTIAAAHDGYRRLPGSPVHRRTWRLDAEALLVTDEIAGAHAFAEALFHFHPSVVVAAHDPQSGQASCGGFAVEWEVLEGRGLVEPAIHHPRFGESLATRRLRVTLDQGRSAVLFRWGAA
jgi:uncharacterized heparinase superfamily protein